MVAGRVSATIEGLFLVLGLVFVCIENPRVQVVVSLLLIPKGCIGGA